jgi:hypothetical protein
LLVDISAVQDAISAYSTSASDSSYTSSSRSALRQAISAARSGIDSFTSQEQADEAVSAIIAAYNGLVQVPAVVLPPYVPTVPSWPIIIQPQATPTPKPVASPIPTSAPTPVPTPEPAIPGLSITTPQVATSVANELYKIGLFVGTGTDTAGNPVFELDRPLTRLEALAVLIRLLGLDEDVAKSDAANPFTDVPEWGERIAAYAYSIGLTVGINQEGTLFGSERLATQQEFTAFLLRILGYSELAGDFDFSEARRKAVEVNLYKTSESASLNSDDQTLRAEAVISIADALSTQLKDSSNKLIDRLVEQKAISREAADQFMASIQSIYPK